jgi:hypothetical protein
MFEHICAAIRQFTRTVRRKRSVVLRLMTLEERAVPAADLLFSVDPPEMATVVELAPVKPIVRIDLVPFSCATKSDSNLDTDLGFADGDSGDDLFADTETPVQTETLEQPDVDGDMLIVSEADLLAAKLTEELRQLTNTGAITQA